MIVRRNLFHPFGLPVALPAGSGLQKEELTGKLPYG